MAPCAYLLTYLLTYLPHVLGRPLHLTLSNFRTRAFERRALVLLPSAAVRPPGGPRRSPRAPRDRQRPLSVVRGRACREEQLFS